MRFHHLTVGVLQRVESGSVIRVGLFIDSVTEEVNHLLTVLANDFSLGRRVSLTLSVEEKGAGL